MTNTTTTFEWAYALNDFSSHFASALVQVLWQGCVIGLVAWLFLRTVKRADVRHLVALSGLVAMACIFFAALLEFRPDSNARLETPDRFARPVSNDLLNGAFTESKTQGLNNNDLPDIAIINPEKGAISGGLPHSDLSQPVTEEEPKITNAWSRWSLWVTGFYLFGFSIMWLIHGVKYFRTSQLKRQLISIEDTNLVERLERLIDQMKLRVKPTFHYCEKVVVPAVIGTLRPVVLIPPAICPTLSTTEFSAIICHELAHIKRLDPWILVFQKWVEQVLFFHPVTWWLGYHLNVERENCCDDLAATSTESKIDYAAALLKVAEIQFSNRGNQSQRELALLSASGHTSKTFSNRIRRLLDSPTTQSSINSWNVSICTAVLLFCMLPLFLASNTQTEQGSSNRNESTTVTADENSLESAVKKFNEENQALGRGKTDRPLTTQEVLDAIEAAQQPRDADRINEEEFNSLKTIAATREMPKGSYFEVYDFQQRELYRVSRSWHIQLKLPAIGHDGFVGFTIRHTVYQGETIDPKQISWGQPDQDGLAIGTMLLPAKKSYRVGERVRLRLWLRNQGKQSVDMTYPNLVHPAILDFQCTGPDGETIPVKIGHEQWEIPWISGYTASQLAPGDVQYFDVPSYIQMGMVEGSENNKLIGRIVDANEGRKVKFQVGMTLPKTNGSKVKTEWIEFAIAKPEGPKAPRNEQVRWGDANGGVRIGIRAATFAEKVDDFKFGDWLRYEVFIRNELKHPIEIHRDPRDQYFAKRSEDTINLLGGRSFASFLIPTPMLEQSKLTLQPSQESLLCVSGSVQNRLRDPGSPPPKYGITVAAEPGAYLLHAQGQIYFHHLEDDTWHAPWVASGDFKIKIKR